MKKKLYIQPDSNVVLFETEYLMTLGDTSGHIGGGDTNSGAPARNKADVF